MSGSPAPAEASLSLNKDIQRDKTRNSPHASHRNIGACSESFTAGDAWQELLAEYLPETKRGSRTVTPSYATRTYFRPVYDDFLSTHLNRYINRIPELLSHFYEPSVGNFTLSDASRFNINFCEGASEAVRKLAGNLKPILFLNHGDRYGLTFYRHLDTFRNGIFRCIK